MAAISKLVAVIPVIAKADTFTAQEMEDFRQELLNVRRGALHALPRLHVFPCCPSSYVSWQTDQMHCPHLFSMPGPSPLRQKSW